jgi:hypothetical protein
MASTLRYVKVYIGSLGFDSIVPSGALLDGNLSVPHVQGELCCSALQGNYYKAGRYCLIVAAPVMISERLAFSPISSSIERD